MSKWFKANISFYKEDNKGKTQKISECYLIDAVSHTDAEARIYQELSSQIPPFVLKRLVPEKLQEVFLDSEQTEKWFKVKVCFVSYDEKSQKEKLTPFNFLINAENPLKAYNEAEKRLGTVEDYQISDVNVTNILAVFPYVKD